MAQKSGGSTPSEKLLQLFTILLFSNEPQSLGRLAKQLNCSKQTVLRILPALEKFGGGQIIEERLGREAFYYIEKPKKINLNLNADGLIKLLICKNFLSHIMPPSVMHEMEIALLRAAEYTGEEDFKLDRFSKMGKALNKGRIDYSKYVPQYTALINAAAEKRVCRVTYKIEGESKNRSIAPVNILISNSAIYVRGWVIPDQGAAEAKYERPITLSLHKISEVKPEKRVWEKLPDIEETGGFGISSVGRFSAAIKFTGDAVEYVSDRMWSKGQTIEKCGDGIILKLTAINREELISWVLSFGSKAEVMEPEDLKEDLLWELNAAAAKYQK